MQAGLAFLLPALLALAFPAKAEGLSHGDVAASLPLLLPGLEAKPGLPADLPPPKPQPSCLVSEGQLPENFLTLMQKLETPVSALPLGSAPENGESSSSAPALPQSRPAAGASRNSTSQGGAIQHSRENGVTVYRGRN